MTTIHRHRDDVISYTKGAPERVLAGCTHYLDEKGQRQPLNAAARQDIEAQNDAMAADALRVLAFAYGRGEEKDMTFIGMLGMADPPREEAKGAVNACMKAGIKVVMVSGDHPKTAQAIGRKLGILKEKDRVMTGGTSPRANR